MNKNESETQSDRRKAHRTPIHTQTTDVELNGDLTSGQILDLSEDGMRLAVSPELPIHLNDTLKITINAVIQRIVAEVIWIQFDRERNRRIVGLRFSSLYIDTIDTNTDSQSLTSQMGDRLDFYDDMIHVNMEIDDRMMDGSLKLLSEAVALVSSWVERHFGPFDVWRMHQESADSIGVTMLTSNRNQVSSDLESRERVIRKTFESGRTVRCDEVTCFYADTVVFEFHRELGDQEAFLRRVCKTIGRRIPFWSKLLLKNITKEVLEHEIAG